MSSLTAAPRDGASADPFPYWRRLLPPQDRRKYRWPPPFKTLWRVFLWFFLLSQHLLQLPSCSQICAPSLYLPLTLRSPCHRHSPRLGTRGISNQLTQRSGAHGRSRHRLVILEIEPSEVLVSAMTFCVTKLGCFQFTSARVSGGFFALLALQVCGGDHTPLQLFTIPDQHCALT